MVFLEKIFLVFSNLWVFLACIMMFIYPLIFNFVIIPKIEKNIGRKLAFKLKVYSTSPLPKSFFKYSEVSFFIIVYYLSSKSIRSLGNLADKMKIRINKNDRCAFKDINYDVNDFSRFEILMSFSVWITLFLIYASAITQYVLMH